MIPLPMLSLPTKILIVTAAIVGYSVWLVAKTHNYVTDQIKLEGLNDKIVVVEKTKEILKLDTKTLQKHLEKQRKDLQAENEYEVNYWKYKADHPVLTDPNCTLDADGLRLWDAENLGVNEGDPNR